MRRIATLAALGLVLTLTIAAQCESPSRPKVVTAAVICRATVFNAAGETTASLEDTVTIRVHTTTAAGDTEADSVVGDPTPCEVTSQGGYIILNAKDSATGNPTP